MCCRLVVPGVGELSHPRPLTVVMHFPRTADRDQYRRGFEHDGTGNIRNESACDRRARNTVANSTIDAGTQSFRNRGKMGSTEGSEDSGERLNRRDLVASNSELLQGRQSTAHILHGETAFGEMKSSLEGASEVIVCGVASQALVATIQIMTEEAASNGYRFPWERFIYITPERSSILPNRGGSRLGSVVQRWETAQRRMGNCAHQYNQTITQLLEAGGFEQSSYSGFHLRATKSLYLEMTMLVRSLHGGRWHLWATVGPTKDRGDDVYLTVDEQHPAYSSVAGMVRRLLQESRELATRQVLCSPVPRERASTINGSPTTHFTEDEWSNWPELKINTLVPHGTITKNNPTCLPTAICVVRSEYSSRKIVLLKKRTAASSTDDLGKLSLLSSRVLEEEVTEALGIPLAEAKSADDAIDSMQVANYIVNGVRGALAVPHSAFVRAAQRELFYSCGLDLTEDRFEFRGCQVIDREESREQIFFCVFEVVLFRRSAATAPEANDELRAALEWNNEKLARVPQDELYDGDYRGRLNRLLDRREDWLKETIFSQPFSALP